MDHKPAYAGAQLILTKEDVFLARLGRVCKYAILDTANFHPRGGMVEIAGRTEESAGTVCLARGRGLH